MATQQRWLTIIFSMITLWAQASYQQQVCVRTVDLIFVLDGSNSVGKDDFTLMLSTVADATATLSFGPDQAQVGAVLYSSVVESEIALQSDRNAFISALQNLPYPDDETATNLGIDRARVMLDSAPDRQGTPKVIMIITDGVSKDRALTRTAALFARSRGIDIWAVGVGAEIDVQELRNIVTSGNADQTFFIDSFKALPSQLQNVTSVVCRDSVVLSTFTPPTLPTTTPLGGFTSPTVPTSTPEPTTSPAPPTPSPFGPTPNVTIPGLEELCPPSSGTVDYVVYPGDCTRVIQCYTNPNTNRVVAVTRQCPMGKFWDNDNLTCADSWTVDCPYDKCRYPCDGQELVDVNGLLSYSRAGSCGAYWACQNKRSVPMCCPEHFEYNPEVGCVLCLTCTNCEKTLDKEGKRCTDGRDVCTNIPDWSTISGYLISTAVLASFRMPCIFGGGYSVHECECVTSGYNSNSGCSPYLDVPIPSCLSSNDPMFLPAPDKKTDSLAYAFRLDVSRGDTDIWLRDSCHSKNKIHIWQNGNQIHAQVVSKTGSGQMLTVFVDRNTKDLAEVTFQYSAGMLTLSVAQGNNQHVAMEEANQKLCMDCDRKVTIQAPGDQCAVTQIQAYACRPNLNLVYGQ